MSKCARLVQKMTVLVISFLVLSIPIGYSDQFFGTVPTGIIQLEEYKYPVFLYVPEQYKPERPLPLIIVMPGLGQDLEEVIEEWKSYAKRRSYILLVPSLIILQGDVPFKADEWLLRIKEDITKKYRVIEERIFLVGVKDGADYAAYLGLNYPSEFTSVGLLNGSWDSPLWKLVKPSDRAVKQIPFFVSFDPSKEGRKNGVEQKAFLLTEKGYPVYFEVLNETEQFSDLAFKKRMFEWLEKKGEDWLGVVREDLKSPAEKFRGWIKAHLTVN